MKLSLDDLDRQSYHAGPSPLEISEKSIVLSKGSASAEKTPSFSLNGTWDFLEMEQEPVAADWSKNSFTGEIPCTVHTALWKAGKIPDPMVGQNQEIAREHSFRTWWLRKRFAFKPEAGKSYRLSFEGIADRCTVWLNGEEIATHQGMFGGPDVDVTEWLTEENTLVVKLEPIPFHHEGNAIPHNNNSWRKTVVINNVYGWHYFNMPSLGVFLPVSITKLPVVELERPFVFTRDLGKGTVALMTRVCAQRDTEAVLQIVVSPHNFEDESYSWRENIALQKGEQHLHYAFSIPNPRVWWPNDLGDPNLYDITVSCTVNGETCVEKCLFGLRTIQMEALPDGPDEKTYNWVFVVNGRKVFIKGTNWCTIDAMLDLRRDRYNRFLTLARQQHLQLLRAWGGGMPETDDFYELCSEYGLMVFQEWPTAWNSHDEQPYDVLEDTVRRHTLRLRSYPALVMYGGGNESSAPFGKAIDMMGRCAIELDGTRPFHRGEGWGGSLHDYASYWEDQHIDHHLTATAPFWGEFGFACMTSYETFRRYMPKESLALFPLDENPDFLIHTPTFGYLNDINHITQSARYFLPKGYTWEEFITASQMTQALGVRRVLERSRARNPECAGVIYYKMNDNSPAVSWSSVDYYGVPKIGHYIFQDSFEPLHACVLFERIGFQNTPVRLPVYLLDDANRLPETDWCVTVRAYNAVLALISEQTFNQRDGHEQSTLIGHFVLDKEQTDSTPLLVVCDLKAGGVLQSRSFYFSNFEQDHGCMFRLPRASVRMTAVDESTLSVANVGKLPAVGVLLTVPGKDCAATYSDNFLWIEPGEAAEVAVSGVRADEVEIKGLNLL